jgi:hypothetical protein
MARRNAPFEVEQIEQLALIARLPTHHGKPPPLNVSSDGITVRRKSRALFSTVSTHLRHGRIQLDLYLQPGFRLQEESGGNWI